MFSKSFQRFLEIIHPVYNILIKKYINRMKNLGPENPDHRPRLFAHLFVSSRENSCNPPN